MLTTTIGSYPKPAYLPISDWFKGVGQHGYRSVDGLAQNWRPGEYEDEKQKLASRYDGLVARAIIDVISQQIACGIDIVTDGEVARENYIYYHCRQLAGIDFSRVVSRSVRNDAFVATVPSIVNEVSFRTVDEAVKEWKEAQSASHVPVKATIPGPLTITDTLARAYYRDDRTQNRAIASAINALVVALGESGCMHIQIDEPAFLRRMPDAIDYGIADLNSCFRGLNPDATRVVHICCGYPNAVDYKSYKKADWRQYEILLPLLDLADVDWISIEAAHSDLDMRCLESVLHKTVVLGVVDVCRSRVETLNEIRSRLSAAAAYIETSRLVVAPDCGLGLLDPETARRKLTRMCTAAHEL